MWTELQEALKKVPKENQSQDYSRFWCEVEYKRYEASLDLYYDKIEWEAGNQ